MAEFYSEMLYEGPNEERVLRKKFESEYDKLDAPRQSKALYIAEKLAQYYNTIHDKESSIISDNTRDAVIYINSNYFYIYHKVIIPFYKNHNKNQYYHLYQSVYDHLENLFGEMNPIVIEKALLRNNIWSAKRLTYYSIIDLIVIVPIVSSIIYMLFGFIVTDSALGSILLTLFLSCAISLPCSSLIDSLFRKPVAIHKWGS